MVTISKDAIERMKRAKASSLEEEIAVQLDVDPWMLNGGAKPREADSAQPVRPTSILGQLRFFWRLSTDIGDVPALREREAELFGRDSRIAPFRLEVQTLGRGTEVPVPGINEEGGYLAFSARPTTNPLRPPATLRRGASVRVALVANGLSGPLSEVADAFHLWLLLGGVGSRTRRGLGAVQAAKCPSTAEELDRALVRLVRTGVPRMGGLVRSFHSVWRSDETFDSGLSALFALERWYKAYRQHRRPGLQRNRPGRSYWDEPELIREATGVRDPAHQKLNLPQGTHAAGWARAALGLPIIFEFGRNHRDPPATTLQGARRGKERMASPMIFRPVRLGSGKYVALVARLSGPYSPPGGLRLIQGSRTVTDVTLSGEADRVFDDLFRAGTAGPLRLREIVPQCSSRSRQ